MTATATQSRLSLSAVRDLQGEANAITRRLAESIAALAAASADMDAAVQYSIAVRTVDAQQRLVNVGRHLASLIEGCEVEQ